MSRPAIRARHVSSRMVVGRARLLLRMLADGNSTCSMSNNDIRHHLLISTATGTTSPSTSRDANGSDFGTISTASPATMSTVYQSVINPYLTAVSDVTTNVVCLTHPASAHFILSPFLDIESLCIHRHVPESYVTIHVIEERRVYYNKYSGLVR